jgi:hypothetical protein
VCRDPRSGHRRSRYRSSYPDLCPPHPREPDHRLPTLRTGQTRSSFIDGPYVSCVRICESRYFRFPETDLIYARSGGRMRPPDRAIRSTSTLFVTQARSRRDDRLSKEEATGNRRDSSSRAWNGNSTYLEEWKRSGVRN